MSYDPERRRRGRVPPQLRAWVYGRRARGRRYDPERRRYRRRRYDPTIRARVRRISVRPFLTGIGAARIGEKVGDFIGIQMVNPVLKLGCAWLGGKWKGLVAEAAYELTDERTDDIWGLVGIKLPTLAFGGLGAPKPVGGV